MRSDAKSTRFDEIDDVESSSRAQQMTPILAAVKTERGIDQEQRTFASFWNRNPFDSAARSGRNHGKIIPDGGRGGARGCE